MSIEHESNSTPSPSIVLLGRRCPFTAIPFARLLRAAIDVKAIFLAAPGRLGAPLQLRRYRPMISIGTNQNSLEKVAGEHNIPLFDVRRPLGDEFRAAIEDFEPDLLVAACFPWLLPPSIPAASRLGNINLHPSLLPRFRGPDPLFWAYRAGAREWGVTVHEIDETFDTGAILAQQSFVIADATPGDLLEQQAATLGAELLLTVLERAAAGTLRGTPQDEASASYQSWPSVEDLLIGRNWSARHALNFVTGVRPLGYEPLIETSRGRHVVRSARLVDQRAACDECWVDESRVRLAFDHGTIEFSVS